MIVPPSTRGAQGCDRTPKVWYHKSFLESEQVHVRPGHGLKVASRPLY